MFCEGNELYISDVFNLYLGGGGGVIGVQLQQQFEQTN